MEDNIKEALLEADEISLPSYWAWPSSAPALKKIIISMSYLTKLKNHHNNPHWLFYHFKQNLEIKIQNAAIKSHKQIKNLPL